MNAQDDSYMNALQVASRGDHVGIAPLLVEAVADFNARDGDIATGKELQGSSGASERIWSRFQCTGRII